MTKLIYKKIIKIVFFCFLLTSCWTFSAYSEHEVMRCNLNTECPEGFVCVGGIGSKSDTEDQRTGCCEIILPIRQVCLFHNFITGKFGHAIVAIVVISIGITAIFGKLTVTVIITFFVGTICIFGSYQVVHLLTGDNYRMCELVDTSVAPGDCPAIQPTP
jgi:hypothetical protein